MKQKLTSPGVARFTKALLDILFYAGIAVTVSLPWTMRWAARFYPSFAARLTLHTMSLSQPWPAPRPKSPPEAAALMAVRLIVLFTPGMLAIVCVFLLAGLFSLVLAQVFDRAVSYKQDNDLTI